MGGATHRFFTFLPAATLPLLFTRRHSSFLLRRLHRRHNHLLILSPSSPVASAEASRRLFHSRAASSFDDHVSTPSPPPEWTRLLDALSAAGYFDRAEAADLAGPPEFTRAAGACLQFARERAGLVRLLSRRDVEIVVRNGTPFLFKDAISSNVLEMDKVSTIDLMRLILSYVSNFIFPSESNNVYNRDLIESSARNLLLEMAKLCYVVPDSNSFDRERNSFANRNGEPMRPFGQKIEMKRGDWICTRCSFMNFARNVKCLECEEARPKSQLTGGEWECPQCDFFNYGKNAACLRCDCKRPGQILVGSGKNEEGNMVKVDIDRRMAVNEEKAQRWFSKISQMDSNSDISSVADDDFPEIMPLRKGVNRFVVSKRKTPIERRLANSEFQTSSGGGGNPNYVPFVPLPSDMFAKKPENPPAETSAKAREITENPPSQVERNTEREEIEKSDRWFKKVAELHNVTDLAGAISDNDFPEIMPMRKGENRFVVGKKKDRSLVSPAYKRQMAIEQTTDAKFVPFVPFPPDYFAKKNDKPQAGEADLATGNRLLQTENSSVSPSSNSEPSMANSTKPTPRNLPQNFTTPPNDRLDTNRISGIDSPTGSSFRPPQDQNAGENRNPYNRIPGKDSPTGPVNPSRISGKDSPSSLEGSAVKEADPLDMSEEAKAERWFRRVAQIKDISELSQIPDEDFPSIMPMRKGVNRFVVSKRKTPLERRLTSPQYRRNIPDMSSDPAKEEDGNG